MYKIEGFFSLKVLLGPAKRGGNGAACPPPHTHTHTQMKLLKFYLWHSSYYKLHLTTVNLLKFTPRKYVNC